MISEALIQVIHYGKGVSELIDILVKVSVWVVVIGIVGLYLFTTNRIRKFY